MCEKVAYPSQREANEVINSFHKSHLRGRTGKKIPCRAYRCPDCGMWHLTSEATYHGKDE